MPAHSPTVIRRSPRTEATQRVRTEVPVASMSSLVVNGTR